jgi:hypothetical protein
MNEALPSNQAAPKVKVEERDIDKFLRNMPFAKFADFVEEVQQNYGIGVAGVEQTREQAREIIAANR